MYSAREALAYKGQLPEQTGKAGISPQLLDILAMQKVQDDKMAAQRQLALASGKPMPTVAESLEQKAMQSARAEIAQKLGIQSLPQAQPPQQIPGQPPEQAPGQPPQEQGVTAIPSNLPQTYSHGGILHFEAGGGGSYKTEADLKNRVGDVASLADSDSEVQVVLNQLRSGKLKGAEREAALAYVNDIVNPKARMPSSPQGIAQVKRFPPNSPVDIPPEVSPPQVAAAPAPPMANISSAPDSRFELTPEELATEKAIQAANLKRINADSGQAEMDARKQYQDYMNPSVQAAIKAKQEGIASLKELYAKDAEDRPSQFWRTLAAIGAKGPGVMPGQWGAGVAEKVTAENEGYNKIDIDRQTNVNNLIDSLNAAIQSNDQSIWNAGREAFIRAETARGTSIQAATTMADAIRRTKSTAANVNEQVLGRLEGRRQADAALLQGRTIAAETARGIADEKAAVRKSEDIRRALEAADKAAANDEVVKAYLAKVKSGMMLPAEQVATEAKIEKIKQSYIERYLQAIGAPVPIAQATPSGNRMKFDAKGNPI
jgi:hypothetical protein